MTPDDTAMRLYLSSWLYGSGFVLYREDVKEAAETQWPNRRGMTPKESVAARYAEVTRHGVDKELLAWAVEASRRYAAGELPPDPHHPDAPSGHTYRGFELTNRDLHDIYSDDLPDGS